MSEKEKRKKKIKKMTLNFINKYREDLEALADEEDKELYEWTDEFIDEYDEALDKLSD